MGGKYTEGIRADSAAILFDGVPLTVSEVLAVLNGTERLQRELAEKERECERLREAAKILLDGHFAGRQMNAEESRAYGQMLDALFPRTGE